MFSFSARKEAAKASTSGVEGSTPYNWPCLQANASEIALILIDMQIDFCAQPYGVNTVGAFPFLFGIMGPVVWGGGTIEEAWKVGCCGNFIVGIINTSIGINNITVFFPLPLTIHRKYDE